MPHHLDRTRVRSLLSDCDLQTLFIEELGWDHGKKKNRKISVGDNAYALEAIAHKRGMVAYQYIADSDNPFPDHPTRQKIERDIAKTVHEHLIVYASRNGNRLYWQWVKREPGRSDQTRQHIYRQGKLGEALIQKLEQITFTLDEEDDVTIVDVSGRVRAAFDVEKVTKKFYDCFKKEHDSFLRFIEGIENVTDREWYASLMLNRMMFIYFIQRRGFLAGDQNYLYNRLKCMQAKHGQDHFQAFYRLFLLRLFHEGLAKPEDDRTPELAKLLGQIPYLNGGLFDVHDLERDNTEIHIPDEAFEKIFDFFDAYQWHLDDRPLHEDNEINPDVLGYIFEKYINQKQMGAYYTKEDITGYISQNTVIPFLFDRAKKECAIAFKPDGGVWRLLSDDPDRYFYEAVRHGITYDIHKREYLKGKRRELPDEIAAGLNDVSKRGDWNKLAPKDYALPTETWREHVARRQHYEAVYVKLAGGEVTSINDLITYNLDIEKFALDVISNSEESELICAFWKAATEVSILDPTCGSGAFLFAALNILEPIYTTCLEAMQGFLDDLDRSERKHSPEKMKDFRKVRKNVTNHASERYFILKSIIVSNLYGVDIMEEAVEICKLRLFLKLVAQLESYDQIEPLPDIDFNVRTGNTLVGFASMDEVKRAMENDFIKQLSLTDIEERAEKAAHAFHRFQEMQTDHRMDATEFTVSKTDLRKRLNDLRAELDRYLASEYGERTDDKKAYRKWRDNHQPFHWFVEFYEIMTDGGFDVIIGNPPYVGPMKVNYSWAPMNYRTCKSKNLYSICMERSTNIQNISSRFGMIIPISLVSGEGYKDIADMLFSKGTSWVSHYSNRPGKLFRGVEQRLTIYIGTSMGKDIFSTEYNHWYEQERNFLLQNITYISLEDYHKFHIFFPLKIGKVSSLNIVKKIYNGSNSIIDLLGSSQNGVWYHDGPTYWIRVLPFEPVRNQSNRSSHYHRLRGKNNLDDIFICSILISNLFYFHFKISSNCRDLGTTSMEKFCFPKSLLQSNFSKIIEQIGERLENTAKLCSRKYASGYIEYMEYYPAKCKDLIDKIDHIFAQHYGFTDEELDFIVNYDIKYRMGRNNLSGKHE